MLKFQPEVVARSGHPKDVLNHIRNQDPDYVRENPISAWEWAQALVREHGPTPTSYSHFLLLVGERR